MPDFSTTGAQIYSPEIPVVPPAIRTLLLIMTSLCAASCSAVIVDGGSEAPRFTTDDTKASVEKVLGKPIASQTYDPPVSAGSFLKSGKFNHDRQAKVTEQADYRVRRWIREPGADNGTALAMWSGGTLGLAEVVTFPASLIYAGGKMREVHRFRVCYAKDGHYVDHEEWREGH
jgi:hypothetical protein